MKLTATLLSTLVGVLFALQAAVFLSGKMPQPTLAPGSLTAQFMGVMGPTGFLSFVKFFELLGGILLAIPKTRNFGLLILCPIVANILAFDILIDRSALVVALVIAVIFLFLLWTERAKILSLLR